jgi:hypothetical protein
MAVIAMKNLVLYDKWPGAVNPNKSYPVRNPLSKTPWDGSDQHDVSIAAVPIGEKRMAYNDATYNPGWYTMMYLQFAEGSEYAFDGNADVTAQGLGSGFCFPYATVDGNMDADGTGRWYLVTNDLTNSCGTKTDAAGGGLAFTARAAIPAGDISGKFITTGRNNFGWFWVGGVCPIADITSFDGDITTAGDVVSMQEVVPTDDGDNGATIGIADWSTCTDGTGGPGNIGGSIIGYSLITDA